MLAANSLRRLLNPNPKKIDSPNLGLKGSEILKSQFFSNKKTETQNQRFSELNKVLQGTILDSCKDQPKIRASLKNIGFDQIIDGSKNEEISGDLINSFSRSLNHNFYKNYCNKSCDDHKPKSELKLKLTKVEFECKSKIIHPDEILSQNRFDILTENIEEINDVFMDEPMGYLMEESRNIKRSRMLLSSAEISKEAEDGIKEFNEKNIRNNLLQVNEVLLYFKKNRNNLDDNLINDYQEDFKKNYSKHNYVNLFSFVILKSFLIFMGFLIQDDYNYIYIFFYVKLALIVSLLFFFLSYEKFKRTCCKCLIVLIYIMLMMEALIEASFNHQKIILVQRLELVIAYLSLTHYMFLNFLTVLFLTVIYVLFELIYLWNSYYENDYLIILLILGLAFLNLGILNYRMKLQINLFNEIFNNNLEKGRLNKVIMYLLPPHVDLILILT